MKELQDLLGIIYSEAFFLDTKKLSVGARWVISKINPEKQLTFLVAGLRNRMGKTSYSRLL